MKFSSEKLRNYARHYKGQFLTNLVFLLEEEGEDEIDIESPTFCQVIEMLDVISSTRDPVTIETRLNVGLQTYLNSLVLDEEIAQILYLSRLIKIQRYVRKYHKIRILKRWMNTEEFAMWYYHPENSGGLRQKAKMRKMFGEMENSLTGRSHARAFEIEKFCKV